MPKTLFSICYTCSESIPYFSECFISSFQIETSYQLHEVGLTEIIISIFKMKQQIMKESDLPKDSRPTEMQLQFRSPEMLLHASIIEPLSQCCNRS